MAWLRRPKGRNALSPVKRSLNRPGQLRGEDPCEVCSAAQDQAMQDGYLARFVATGAAIGAMAGVLLGDSPSGLLWGLVIGTLSVSAWAWNRRFAEEAAPALAPDTATFGLQSETGSDTGAETRANRGEGSPPIPATA